MAHFTNTAPQQETAVLVALTTPKQPRAKTEEYLRELASLADTLGIATLHTFTQKVDTPNKRTFVGKGKLEEIKEYVKENQVDAVIFDDALTPSQVRNIEAILECKAMDRNLLILEIFAMRAKTTQAKTQVELAQYRYLLPRLTRMWTHLSRQKGGSANMRGPGEKELETDKRIILDKITQLRKQLAVIARQNTTQSKKRPQLVRVALVGYTNAGKSTLMQLLSKSAMYTEDKLFATLDSTVRKMVLQDVPFLLTDTVGFIRKLPHTLVECFKSTLSEIREADILLHVVDGANPAHLEHITTVQKTLQEIGAANIPTMLVFNKADQIARAAEETEATQEAPTSPESDAKADQASSSALFISATQQTNIAALKELLFEKVAHKHGEHYPNHLKTAAP